MGEESNGKTSGYTCLKPKPLFRYSISKLNLSDPADCPFAHIFVVRKQKS